MSRIWRQGDVVVRELTQLPENASQSESNEIRIASESGNPHVLRGKHVFSNNDPRGSSRVQYVVLEEPTSMTHPQHAPLQLLPGTYLVTTVRDYAPSRRLMD